MSTGAILFVLTCIKARAFPAWQACMVDGVSAWQRKLVNPGADQKKPARAGTAGSR